ncbi:MAG: J domain-containing protein [Halobacteriales archaeon]
MNRARFLLGLASVLAGTTVLLVVLGAVYNPFIIVLAVPFGVGTYMIWADATGRIEARARQARQSRRARGRRREERRERARREGDQRQRAQRGDERRGRTRRRRATSDGGARGSRRAGSDGRRGAPSGDPGPTPEEARRVLGVAPDADEDEIRRAYRERAKDVHPDTAGGDEEAFKRVTEAYDRLVE